MNIQNDILCPECGKDFGTLPRFHKHFRQYHKKNESKCTSCEKTFNTAYILRQHVTKVHETKKYDICDLDFAKGALARHKRIHLECEKCDKVFIRKDKLQTHKQICGTNYKFKEKNSDAYGEALLAAIVHFNSNNLGFV